MDINREGLHIREPVIGQVVPFCITGLSADVRIRRVWLAGPAVIDIDKLVAAVGHTGANHRSSGAAHFDICDVILVSIPVIPAHLRRESDGVTGYDGEHAFRVAKGIGCPDEQPILTRSRCCPRNEARPWIQREGGMQILYREVYRTCARAWNAIEEGMARPYAVNLGTVNARRRTRQRRAEV